MQPQKGEVMTIPQMIALEEAQELVRSRVQCTQFETVDLLEAIGRVAAEDLKSDIDISPFNHSAMDGFALRADEISQASPDHPVVLKVIGEIPAGSWFDGDIKDGECVRIMTGAPLPSDADAVVKYEIVEALDGDGHAGSLVSFSEPCSVGSNVRYAGEEAKADEVIVHAGEVIHAAGVGFLASCGIMKVKTYAHPTVAIIATGSELVDPTEVPTKGKIRNSNSYALAACALEAGAIPHVLSSVADDYDSLLAAVTDAAKIYDFVITSGGAANGDYDFIKRIVDDAGELLMTTVNMRPGKAQTFGFVEGTPVFGLPGNPAAAYLGFEMIIRPALRKMQGYSHFNRPIVKAKLASDQKKKDPRRIFSRATFVIDESNNYVVTPAINQSSGLFGPLQRSNCLMIMPEGTGEYNAGEMMDCVVLDVPEEVAL